MIEILQLLLQLVVEWPQRRTESAKKSYSEWRNGYAKAKEDRANRAALADSTASLRNGENKP